jgi:hypothetical protein
MESGERNLTTRVSEIVDARLMGIQLALSVKTIRQRSNRISNPSHKNLRTAETNTKIRILGRIPIAIPVATNEVVKVAVTKVTNWSKRIRATGKQPKLLQSLCKVIMGKLNLRSLIAGLSNIMENWRIRLHELKESLQVSGIAPLESKLKIPSTQRSVSKQEPKPVGWKLAVERVKHIWVEGIQTVVKLITLSQRPQPNTLSPQSTSNCGAASRIGPSNRSLGVPGLVYLCDLLFLSVSERPFHIASLGIP